MSVLSKLKDWSGRLVKRNHLEDDQTSSMGMLSKEFANHPSRGLTPRRLASILQDAEQGNLKGQCDLFEDMEEKDAHIFAEMSKRKRALLGLDWDIVPPRNATPQEEKATEQLRELFQDLDNFEDTIFDMADAIGKGYSNLEIDWQLEEGFRLPRLNHRPARWFTIEPDDRNKLLLRTESGKGQELWPMGWVSHIHKAKSGYVARGGLHRVLAWPYLFKNYSVRDLAEFLEIYGIPVRLGTYPSGATDKEKLTLLQAVVSIGHNAAGIIPEGMAMEFKEAAKGASGPFQSMIAWCEGSVSKAILGGTLTTNAESTGLGSNLGDVHNEVRHDLMISDAKQIAGTLTRDLVWPMAALNISGVDPRRAPRFEFDTGQPEELNTFSLGISRMVGVGMTIPQKWAHEKLGIPEPVDNEPILERQMGPSAGIDLATAAAKAKAEPRQEELDGFVEQLQAGTQPVIYDALDQVRDLLEEVDSLEEFQDRLLEAFGYLDPEALAQVMQLGLAAADLAGRYEVSEE